MAYKQLKRLIDEQGIGGRDEHWWYLCLNPNNGTFYIEHRRDYQGYKGQSDVQDSEKVTLSEAKTKHPSIYKKAIAALKEQLFMEQ